MKRYTGTVWEARGQYWLGRLLLAVPHQGYRVGDRLYRRPPGTSCKAAT